MLKKAIKAWGKKNAEGLFRNIHTKTIVEAVSKLLQKRVPYSHMVSAVNNEVIKRLRRVGRGHQVQKGMIQGDLKNAVSNMDLGRLDVLVARDLDLPSGTGDLESETDNEVLDQGLDKDSSEDDGPRKPRRKTGSAEGKKPVKTLKKGCGCKLTDSTIARFQGPQFEGSATQQEKLKVLRHAGRSLGDFNEANICYAHAKSFGLFLRLYTRTYTHPQLATRLTVCYKHIGDWKKFEQDNPTWFYKKTASGAPATIFRFRPKIATPEIADFESCGLSSRDLYKRCFGVLEGRDKDLASSVLEEFSLEGTVVLEGLFA
ncbi:uncharacterized protein N7484_010183 [Penicillium longicatenatum]|uniref:uncharacterized protein n=1 Tax=Penicillium longicatenatum TaxID=1561947 RepID=UPI002547352F|nr:uncharacterized protein N7484_010183 [Penicillium longicatenatum]KAJ5636870.1 hypothetical protein N7484_010183 [Penicillium longicatenatum]